MIFETQLKHKKLLLIASLAVLIVGVGLIFYSPIIFQEGNPWPQIKGIVQLNFGNREVVKLDIGDNKYITKSDNPEIIKSFMRERGYEFTEQMGAGYLFQSSTRESAVVVHRYYSRYYSLWSITENKNNNPETDNNLWVTTTNAQGITFQYPKELLAKYVSVAEWPPVVKIETGTYACQTTPLEVSSMSNITSERLVDDRTYCVSVEHEGAAGSVYASYTYTTADGGQLIVVSFTLRYPNCNNYGEEENRSCAKEREAFDLDATVDRIVQTIKQITDYDDCVGAGFAIMKSNPPQCATPDGRTFVEGGE